MLAISSHDQRLGSVVAFKSRTSVRLLPSDRVGELIFMERHQARNGQSSLDLMVAAILAALLLASWRRYRWVMAIGVGLYGLWTWLQIDSWWVPYFRGASPGWKAAYARYFGATVKVLPSDTLHLSPDACHIVLQVLLLAALVSTCISTFLMFSSTSFRVVKP